MLPSLTGDSTYDTALAVGALVVLATTVVGPFVRAPYGRFGGKAPGVSLDPRLGWFLMELPATLSFFWFFAQGANRAAPVPLLFAAIWTIHYGNRGFLFPARMRVSAGARGSFSLGVVVIGWFVTALHGYLNATWISHLGAHLTSTWLTDPRFIGGLALYALSLAGNLHSDGILRNLRTDEDLASDERVYRIPQGGLFRWVSSPSYFTELGMWIGFAVATWSPGALFVLGISAANLVPRALQTHRWYHERFPDYPAERKALIPFVL